MSWLTKLLGINNEDQNYSGTERLLDTLLRQKDSRKPKPLEEYIPSQTTPPSEPIEQEWDPSLPLTKEQTIQLADVAEKYGMTPSEMLASYYQESSFGTNPSINEENSASALGPFQITSNYTQKNERGLPVAYPGYEELFIEPEDRKDLMKSAEFRGKHFKRFMDNYQDRDAAINAYYGDSTYAPLIRSREQEEVIKKLLEGIGR